MTTIAFLGLGAMGQRMAMHLVERFDVVVFNRTASRAQGLLNAGGALGGHAGGRRAGCGHCVEHGQ